MRCALHVDWLNDLWGDWCASPSIVYEGKDDTWDQSFVKIASKKWSHSMALVNLYVAWEVFKNNQHKLIEAKALSETIKKLNLSVKFLRL